MLSGRRLSVHQSDQMVVRSTTSDRHGPWLLAAWISVERAVWATTGAGTNVSDAYMSGRAAGLAKRRGMGMVSSR